MFRRGVGLAARGWGLVTGGEGGAGFVAAEAEVEESLREEKEEKGADGGEEKVEGRFCAKKFDGVEGAECGREKGDGEEFEKALVGSAWLGGDDHGIRVELSNEPCAVVHKESK